MRMLIVLSVLFLFYEVRSSYAQTSDLPTTCPLTEQMITVTSVVSYNDAFRAGPYNINDLIADNPIEIAAGLVKLFERWRKGRNMPPLPPLGTAMGLAQAEAAKAARSICRPRADSCSSGRCRGSAAFVRVLCPSRFRTPGEKEAELWKKQKSLEERMKNVDPSGPVYEQLASQWLKAAMDIRRIRMRERKRSRYCDAYPDPPRRQRGENEPRPGSPDFEENLGVPMPKFERNKVHPNDTNRTLFSFLFRVRCGCGAGD